MVEKWVVTYGTIIDVDISNYAYVCDILEESLENEVKKYYPELKFAEDNRDGESFSVRFLISGTPNPPKKIVLNDNLKTYTFNELELEPEKFIYPDNLHEIVDKYIGILRELKVPFDAASIGLILQAMVSLENQIYDGTVVLCRSAIDSSLYLACTYIRKTYKNGETKLILITPKSFLSKNKKLKWVKWDILSDEVKNKFPNLSEKLDDINIQVRALGNFAAHLGENQIRGHNEWFEKYAETVKKVLEGEKNNLSSISGYKLWTSFNEAEYALEETISFLMELVDNYNQIYK